MTRLASDRPQKTLCRVTGLAITTWPEWTDVDLGEGYSVTFKLIGQRILYSYSRGNAGEFGMAALMEKRREFVDTVIGPDEPFFELRDYSGITGRVTRASRDQLAKGMFATEHRTIGFIGINAPLTVRLALNVGRKILRARFPLSVVDKYETAIEIAIDSVKRAGFKVETTASPVTLHDDPWRLRLDDLEVSYEFPGSHIIHIVLRGSLKTNHIPDLIEKRNGLLDLSSLFQVSHHVIIGLPGEHASEVADVESLITEIESWYHDYPVSSLYFYGGGTWLRSKINFQRSHRRFPTRAVKNFASALETVTNDQPERTSAVRTFFGIQEDEKLFTQADIEQYMDELLHFVGRINWQVDGCEEAMTEDPRHPFKPVFDAIRILKGDLDTLLIARDRTEKALRESEEKYRGIFESIVDVYYRADLDGHLTLVSPSALTLFGYEDLEELLGKDIALTVYKEKNDHDAFVNMLKERGQVTNYEVLLKRKDGTSFVAETNSRLVYDDRGLPVAVEGLIRDTSERKVAEEERQELERQLQHAHRMESIGTLAGGIAHDFNNILGAMIGYAELACEDVPADSEARESLQEILAGGKRAKDLVQHILTFSRQSDPEKKPIKAPEIVEETLKMVRPSLPPNVHVKTNLNWQADPIMANATQIQQIIMNLSTNAIHAMAHKGGRLDIHFDTVRVDGAAAARHPDLEPGAYGKLTVRDAGCGISPEIMGRIFDPFFSTKSPANGTGMGLAVVHGIVKSHHGAIEVESEIEEGTIINIFLPTNTGAPIEEMDAEIMAEGGVERVLLVDDEPSLAKLGQKILERLGYEVVKKTNSHDALAAFVESPNAFDVIVTDYAMAYMTGIELATAMKEIRPDIPVVLCSGYGTLDTERKDDEASVDAVVMKPILKNELGHALRRVLDQREDNPSFKRHRILVIDDDDQFRVMLKKRLERAGYQVADAANGKDGTRLFHTDPPDITITDLIMPEQEGLETIQSITRTHPDAKIIAISGGGSMRADDYLPIAKKLGALKIYKKPLEWNEFLAGVKGLLAEAV